MGLNVGVLAVVNLLRALDGKELGLVDILASAVVALSGISLGILVGQLRTLGFHNHGAGVVLRSNELDVLLLTGIFLGNGFPELGIELRDFEITSQHGNSSMLRCRGCGTSKSTTYKERRRNYPPFCLFIATSPRKTSPAGKPLQERFPGLFLRISRVFPQKKACFK